MCSYSYSKPIAFKILSNTIVYITCVPSRHPEEGDNDLSADSTSSEEELGATPNPKPVKSQPPKQTGLEVDIDITMSAYSNIRRYCVINTDIIFIP